jgi:ankyrin repeat protein
MVGRDVKPRVVRHRLPAVPTPVLLADAAHRLILDMPESAPLPFTASLGEYLVQSEQLLADLHAGDVATAWRFKWEHPRYRDERVDAVRAEELGIDDAKLVVAHAYAFETWDDLATFTDVVQRDRGVARFETAADALVGGDRDTLEALLREDPALAAARSARRHRATLLHYVAANGVEGWRQRTPPNVLEIARLLLDAGADANAVADMYGDRCTTLAMLVSSSPPADAGLQRPLAELLVDRGAALELPGSRWNSAVLTALAFGFLDTARALAMRHGGVVRDVAVAAGLGFLGDTSRLLPAADAGRRQAALVLACMHGHTQVVAALLDADVDPDRYNPDGFHAHSTPLHQAAWGNHFAVVRLLVERGARLDLRDRLYDATPFDWAVYGQRTEIADYLRGRSHPSSPVAS